jgi:hypothetical protein
MPLCVDRKPPSLDIAACGNAVTGMGRHPAAAFRFSCALMCSFFSASA